jgi:uncharacterized HAD superfamily protein
MRIGLDFDNTIVCYDKAIRFLADQYLKLPSELPRTKIDIRNFLRAEGREHEWSEFQGEIYGPGMRYAEPFEGAIETMLDLKRKTHELYIVSHRTLKPYVGQAHDLHSAAREWIETHLKSVGLLRQGHNTITFLETREEKIRQIEQLGCNIFVDDLPEVFKSGNFPARTRSILFDPSMKHTLPNKCRRIRSWHELSQIVTAQFT